MPPLAAAGWPPGSPSGTRSSAAVWRERASAGEIELDGRPPGPDERLTAGGVLVWRRPPWREPDVPLAFALLHRDEQLLAVAKPRGLPTLPNGGFLEHTLQHLVRGMHPEASAAHRLGRGTSGLVLFAARPRRGAAWPPPGGRAGSRRSTSRWSRVSPRRPSRSKRRSARFRTRGSGTSTRPSTLQPRRPDHPRPVALLRLGRVARRGPGVQRGPQHQPGGHAGRRELRHGPADGFLLEQRRRHQRHDAERVRQFAISDLGFDPGDWAKPTIPNPDRNLFMKLSGQLGQRTQFEVTYANTQSELAVLVHDPFGANSTRLREGYQFDASGYNNTNTNESIRARLNSQLGDRITNEFLINRYNTYDERAMANRVSLMIVGADSAGAHPGPRR